METVLGSDSEEQPRDGGEEEEKDNGGLEEGKQLLLSLDQTHDSCPDSYRINSPAEIRLLSIADNFQRQYSHLCPDRKPLLLCPVNECGVKKFVSTTVRPTATTYPELFTWEGCASFVADFLSLDLLEPPVELPRFLFSPTSVLQSQRATCFEFATLLCSLLLGANYDAYCVSGYAVKEMCVLDQSLQDCPLLDAAVKCVTSEQKLQKNNYSVKPEKELVSHFMMQQEKKKQDAEAALLQKLKLQEKSEQRPADPLRGLRVHCWVLVLAGSRSVQENFFIDPLTGISYGTADDNFLGIESVWNNLNYYVNMQDCRDGCADVVFDLEDLSLWEPVLYGATSKKQLILEASRRKELKMMSQTIKDEEDDEKEPLAFEMPRSWVSYITISKKDLETRWPGGQKTTRYRKTKLEKFAAYLRSDGLVARWTTYKDQDWTEVAAVKERYQHRNDHLEERDVNKVDNFTTERFKHGRRFHLLFHRYLSLTADSVHDMEFSSARVDNLVRRTVSPNEMTETFDGRADLLHHRHVVFDRRVQFSEPDVDVDPRGRPLQVNTPEINTDVSYHQFRAKKSHSSCKQQVVERFHRDRSKPADEDVAERVFLPAQRRIDVTYHLDDHRFIPSKRNFIKPRESTEQKKAEDFTQDMVSSFQVDPTVKPLNTLTLYEMLASLMKDEEKTMLQITASKTEVRDIVSCRQQEDKDVQLFFSPWTTTGTTRARSQRQEMERVAAEEQRWLQEKENDVLAPLLIRLGDVQTLSADDAEWLYHDCLNEFKLRLVEHANLIQERYDKETQELQRKQLWYHKNQLDMTEQQEEEYQEYCSKKTLQIHVARKRLSMHKEAALLKYRGLDQRLKRDHRLAPYLLG